MTQSNPLSPEERGMSPQDETATRQIVLVMQSLFVSTFLFLVLAVYLTITTGAWQSIVFAIVAGVATAFVFVDINLVRRGQIKTAGWLLLSMNSIGAISASLLYINLGYVAVAYILITNFFIIRYVMFKETRRLGWIITTMALLISAAAELINPIWRQTTQLLLTLAPIITAILGVAIIVVVAREAWQGNIRVKIVTAFTIVALVSLGILGAVTYFNYRNQVREDIRQRLLNIVSITAIQQDGDLHAALQTAEDNQTEVYQQMVAVNDAILATDPDLEYVYTMRLNEAGQIEFVLDSGVGEDYERVDVGYVYEDASQLLTKNFATLNHPIVEEEFYSDEWGTFLSAYAPIYKQDGTVDGIVGVDITADKVVAQERSVLYLILGTTGAALVIVTLLGLWLGTVFTRPILDLSHTAQNVADGDLSARAEIDSKDEVGDLARIFNSTTTQLQQTLSGLEQRVAARTQDLAIVAEVGTATATILESERLLQEVVDLTKERFNLYHSHIYLMDENGENLVLTAGAGEPGRIMVAEGRSIPLNREQSLVARAARERQGVTVNDVTQAPDHLPNPLLPDTRSELAVPMIVGGNVIGVFDIQSEQVGRFTDSDINIQTTLAAQLAVSIQNVRSFERSRKEAELQSLVNVIGSRIQQATSIEDTLQTAIRELGTAIGATRVKASIKTATDGGATETVLSPKPVAVQIESAEQAGDHPAESESTFAE